MYNICFSLVGNKEVAPKVLEFFYQNELDFLEHKVKLQKQKMRILIGENICRQGTEKIGIITQEILTFSMVAN
jgi:hypothetical protein